MSRFEIKMLAAMTAVSVAILAAAGRFAPQMMPDTPGYLTIVGYPAMLAQPRAPLYGWLLAALDPGMTMRCPSSARTARSVPARQPAHWGGRE